MRLTVRRTVAQVALGAVLALTLGACRESMSDGAAARPSDHVGVGAIEGVVTATGGPLDITPDGRIQSALHGTPMPGQVVLRAGNTVVATTIAEASGRYTFSVTPGSYVVEAQSCPGRASVAVTAERVVVADIDCVIH